MVQGIRVERYDVFLDFHGYDYEGVEKIKMSTEGNNEFSLDTKGLIINEVRADGVKVKFEVKDDKLIIYSKVNQELEIKFHGRASDKSLLGIYVAPYDGKYLITTQFSPIYARRFIPCFDNPSPKAVFKLTVKVDKGLKIISNMPILSVKDDGKTVYEFYETPKMSTYLLYLGIGDFEEIVDDNGKPKIIVATTPGKSKRGIFALNLARKLLNFYENYFEIPYPLPKLHLIAIPDFAVGAMENWGAVTFKEGILLVDDSSPITQKLSLSEVMAHELAHKWFGNLVTMKEWRDLWLKESFATFMSYKSLKYLKYLFPQPELNEGDFRRRTLNALFQDSFSDTHPVQANVKDPYEIEQIFDSISYDKGAAVLRMIEVYIGEETFRKGLIEYLNSFKFANAEGKDLWNSISKIAGSEIGNIMADWITKPGYPVVFVRVNEKEVEFSQQRFMLNDKDNTIYKIPLTYEINGNPYTFLLDKEKNVITFDQSISSIKVNLDRTGFYRVFYIPLEFAFSSKLNPYEELGLMNDYWNFLLAGLIEMKDYLNFITRYVKTENALLSNEILSELNLLYIINKEKYYNVARDFMINQIKLYKSRKDELGKVVYYSLLKSLSTIDEDFASDLSELFKDYDNLDENLKESVAIAYAISANDFEGLFSKYKSLTSDDEKNKILNAMLNMRDRAIVSKIISLLLERSIKLQEIIKVINGLVRNPFTREEACNYLKDNFDKVKELASTAMGRGWGLSGLIREGISMCGIEKPREIMEFLDTINYKEIERAVNHAKEMIKVYHRIKDLTF